MTDEELMSIAAQLKGPHGAKGIDMAAMMHETNIGMTLSAIESLAIADHDTILELGHGNAGHLSHILDKHPSVQYHGLETSTLMHDEAKSSNQAYTVRGRATFYLYDGMDVPFEENTFDKIFTVNTLYFWVKPVELLSSLYRILKPGGKLSITFAQRSFMETLPFTRFGFELYDTEKAKTLVAQTAFVIVGVRSKTEKVKNKMGELVDREYTTLTVTKL
ncbi:class I SAM-dependent methyltransferase [Dawidia soli]|uniref:Methyltransferase domain-containing protein n=1 Tax=Dawidia soli TaxID=2782352 RepID=A0AAP2D9N3_9BACT|nr:class I SAM-dependent methyltransferase [Dawidia soli]MBT1688018.1 methyltransferase domain-containing protein [Dawidia soli]